MKIESDFRKRQKHTAARVRIRRWCVLGMFICYGINAFQSATAAACLPASEAAIDGLVPGQDQRVLIDRPTPTATKQLQGEDDGGAYTATLLRYERYQVIIVRELVDSVRTRSPAITWGNGIIVGNARSQIDGQIGYARVFDSEEESQYLVCSEVGDVYAILRFESGKLTEIEVVLDRP